MTSDDPIVATRRFGISPKAVCEQLYRAGITPQGGSGRTEARIETSNRGLHATIHVSLAWGSEARIPAPGVDVRPPAAGHRAATA